MAAATAPSPPQQAGGFTRWVPSLLIVNLNTLNPFANVEEEKRPSSEQVRRKEDLSKTTSSIKNRKLLSTFTLGANPSTPRDTSPSRSNAGSIMFAEPDRSVDGDSQEGSVLEERRSSRLRSNKAKTCYSVCHPPTVSLTRSKLHRRPRSLLQLHRLSPNARPVPAFEVITSANFNVRLTKEITKVFRTKHGLCPNDFVVLRAERYATADEADEGEQEARDIIGLICNRRKDKKDDPTTEKAKAKICITSSGAEWEACSLPSGGYEFFTTDTHGLGLTVRWVPKKNKDGSKATSKDGSLRFNFSTISPNSRRHPVISALSRTGMEVYDTYKLPEANVTPPPTPSKRNSNSALGDAMEEEGVGKDQRETDDALREVITMTAVWVTFKEGWSPTFKYDYTKDREAVAAAGPRSASVMSTQQNYPSKSSHSILSLSTPPGSPSQATLEKRNSIKSVGSSILRRSSLLGGRANRASQASSVPEEDLHHSSTGLHRSKSVNKKTGRARGDSTSTVLVHRAASNRRKNNQQATWRPDLLAAQRPLNEASRENLDRTLSPAATSVQRKEAWEAPDAVAGRRASIARPLIPVATESDTPIADESRDVPAATPQNAQKTLQNPSAQASTNSSTRAPAAAQQRKLRPGTPVSPEKRVSDATTTTTASSVQHRSMKTGRSKRKGGWRRLLCGGGQDV